MGKNLTPNNLPHSRTECGNFFDTKFLLFLIRFYVINIQNDQNLYIWELTYYIKLLFRTFRICPVMSQLQFIYELSYLCVGYKMGTNLTSNNLPHSCTVR